MNSKDCTGSTFSIIIVPPFMISFNFSSNFSFIELHPVNDIMVFCLYCLKIKIICFITKLIIRSALALLQFFFFPSLSFPHFLDFAAFVMLLRVAIASLEGVGGLVLVKFKAFISCFFLKINYTST